MDAIVITKSIFSRNVSDIIVDVDSAISCPITISADGITTSFILYPSNDKVCIHTSDILENFNTEYDPLLYTDFKVHSMTLKPVTISVGEPDNKQEFLANTIFGGYDNLILANEHEFVKHNFLTNRPQVSYTYSGVKERLVFAIYNKGPEPNVSYPTSSKRNIYIRVYFKESPSIQIEWGTIETDITLNIIDCSLNTIANSIHNICTDDIVAYDVYGEEQDSDSVYIYPQRFIVRPNSNSLTHFLFQNTLGGFDSITASGTVVNYANGEIKTSKVRRQETETSNRFTKSYEVNTGYIVSSQEENLWHEFLRSTNRYIQLNNGSYRKIIIEEYKAEHTKMNADYFTFKFHYAEETYGEYFGKDSKLPQYPEKREAFHCAEGPFILADGGTFNVLKYKIKTFNKNELQ